MADKLSKFERLHNKYISETKPLYQTKEAQEVFERVKNGENKYLRLDRIESSAMDMTWIKEVEETIPALGEIVGNPKKTIQTLSEVVQVEKAKKTSRESVQHLSAHTEFIKTIDEDGNVTPNKILNVYSDDFYAIYENKFIATLIRRLIVFVEKRYDYVLHQAKLRDVELLYFKGKTEIDGSEVEIETKVRYSKPAPDSEQDKLKALLKRIEDVRKYLRFYTYSEFMHILRRERDVKNPILQTNIIRKNPKYRKCYQLWQFINRYQESGLEVKVEEKYSQLSPLEIEEINKTMFVNLLALKGKEPSVKVETKSKVYKPRILNNYDDSLFRPEPYYASPIEFVRVDDKYREYKEKLEELNPHPTKAEANYNAEKYLENKIKREETKQVDSLINRKGKEVEKYNKEQDALLKKEIEELEIISDMAEQEVIKDQEEKLAPYREAIKRDAIVDDSIFTNDRSPNEVVDDSLTTEPVENVPPMEEKKEGKRKPLEKKKTTLKKAKKVVKSEPKEKVEEIKPQNEDSKPAIEEKIAVVEEPIKQEPVKEAEPIKEEVKKVTPKKKANKKEQAKERKEKREQIRQAKILKVKTSRKKFGKK